MKLSDNELEQWAAEKVMGWVEIIPQIHAPMVYYGSVSDDLPMCSCTVVKDQWHPLTDLNQTFQVVDRMRERGYYINYVNGLTHHSVCFMVYKETQISPSMGHFERAGDTGEDTNLAKAILIAAWSAIEEV
jgi:hypothetical protein